MTRRFRPWLWLLLPVLIVLGLARLRFDVEVLNLLPANIPAVQGLKLYQENFANARELILTVRAPDPEQAESAAHVIAERLRGQTNLVAEVTWQPPWLEHPGQTAELIAYLWFNQPPDVINQLTNRLAPEGIPATLASVRERLATSMSPGDIARLSYDPLGLTQLPESVAGAAAPFGQSQGRELFSSADGTFRLLFVQAAGDLATYRDCSQWLQRVRKIVQGARGDGEIPAAAAINYTGRPAFVAEISGGMILRNDFTNAVLNPKLDERTFTPKIESDFKIVEPLKN